MDIRSLEYFVSAAESGSFTSAAEAMRVSQPSLSEGIRKLELQVDAPLFHRVGKGVVLSESGQVLLPRARQILQEVDEARDEMVALRGLRGGRIRIGAPPGLMVDPLARFIGSFHVQHPKVVISMFPAEDGGVALQAVQTARCEIGIVDRLPTSTDIVTHLIAYNQIMVASPPGTRYAASGKVKLPALAGASFISSLTGTRTRTVLDEARQRGIDLRVVVETPHREAVVPLVLEAVGSAFLTESVAREAAKRGAVVAAIDPPQSYEVYLIHRAKPLTRAAAAFVKHALQHSGIPASDVRSANAASASD
jgi:LysR family carnitine catabolism transcriptional activator